MPIVLESFVVESPEHAKPFTIDLVEGLDDAHASFIEGQWKPILERQRNLAVLNFFQLPESEQTDTAWIEMRGTFACQDAHWDWPLKCAIAPGANRKVLALLNAVEVEAAMVLHLGKASPDTGLPIVYVDYLAVAPWNRDAVQSPQRFRGLGTVLIGAAVRTSMSLGYDGRCGLHSLPQSEGFYRRIGMGDLGVNGRSSPLRYFEFSAASAEQFVKKGEL